MSNPSEPGRPFEGEGSSDDELRDDQAVPQQPAGEAPEPQPPADQTWTPEAWSGWAAGPQAPDDRAWAPEAWSGWAATPQQPAGHSEAPAPQPDQAAWPTPPPDRSARPGPPPPAGHDPAAPWLPPAPPAWIPAATSLASSQAPPRRRRRGLAAGIIAAILLIGAVSFAGIAITHSFWRSSDASTTSAIGAGGAGNGSGGGAYHFAPSASSSVASTAGSLSSATVRSIAGSVSPALVNINVTDSYQGSKGAATGVVLTPTGLVLTNNHVINGATQISATDVGNGQTYSATVVGYDKSHDIAVIQLKGASDLKTAQFGDSSKALTGQAVVAIGNAGGKGGTPSYVTGNLVAMDQQITATDAGGGGAEQLQGLMQTDAPIQPGDSGGPLVNGAGQIIGIDTAASSGYSLQSSQSQGFAVPSVTALSLATLIANHQASATIHIGPTAFLGVAVSPAAGQGFGDLGGQGGVASTGATVADVLPGTPAAGAGIVAGDVITAVNGRSVVAPTSLSTLLSRYHPGDSVTVTWTDQAGAQHSTVVKLASGPAA
jgi:S1-C subfamily serine protease